MRARWWLENAQVRFCESLEVAPHSGVLFAPLAERELCDTGARVTCPRAIAACSTYPGPGRSDGLEKRTAKNLCRSVKDEVWGSGKVTCGAQKLELQRSKCMTSDPPRAVIGLRELGETARQKDEGLGYKSASWLASQDRKVAEAGT
jgi:hypothetical protein